MQNVNEHWLPWIYSAASIYFVVNCTKQKNVLLQKLQYFFAFLFTLIILISKIRSQIFKIFLLSSKCLLIISIQHGSNFSTKSFVRKSISMSQLTRFSYWYFHYFHIFRQSNNLYVFYLSTFATPFFFISYGLSYLSDVLNFYFGYSVISVQYFTLFIKFDTSFFSLRRTYYQIQTLCFWN